MKSIVGKVTVTEKQAHILGLKPYSQLSPLFEKNCLLLSGNESFQNVEKDIFALTGIKVSHSTLQRLVQRQEYEEPQALQGVSEVSIDGGKVRLRSGLKGVESYWRDYKRRFINKILRREKASTGWRIHKAALMIAE